MSSSILPVKEDFSVVQLPLNTGLSYCSFQVTHTVSMEGSPESFGRSSSRVAELGARLRLSCTVMYECGAPIYPSDFKSQQRYSQKVKVNIGA